MSSEFYLTCVFLRNNHYDFAGSRPSLGYAISRENYVILCDFLKTKLSEILADWKTFPILLTSAFLTLIVVFVFVVDRTP